MGKLGKIRQAASGWGKMGDESYNDEEEEYTDTDDSVMPDLEEDFSSTRDHASPIYKSLKPFEIRLFSMVSTVDVTDQAEIVLSLENYHAQKAPPYSALSYCWGNPLATVSLQVNGKLLPITDSLNTALRRLRTIQQRDHIQYWWVDAICIDQLNLRERSEQVMLMREIFRGATSVVVWLGESQSPNSNALCSIKAIKSFFKHHEGERITAAQDLKIVGSHLDGVSDLIANAYFTRLWMVQETMAARRAVFYAGDMVEDWDSVANVCKWVSATGLIWSNSPDFSRNLTRAQSLLLRHESPTLLHLLCRFRGLKCFDDRDKVFALLTTSRENRDTYDVLPDYTRSIAEVYTNICRFIIQRSRQLHVLSCVQEPTKSFDLPSWTPDWRRPWSHMALDVYFGAEQVHHVFRASEGMRAMVNSSKDPGILKVKGVQVDTIGATYKPKKDAILGPSNACQKFVEAVLHSFGIGKPETLYLRTREPYHEALFRTLSADFVMKTPSSFSYASTPVTLPLADEDDYHDRLIFTPRTVRRWHSTPLNHTYMSPWTDSLDAYHPTAIEAYSIPETPVCTRDIYKHIQNLMIGRLLFITEAGYLGLGPDEAQPADSLVVLPGADVPFVLRSVDEDEHNVIGECYLHGFMDGEAVEGIESEALKEYVLR